MVALEGRVLDFLAEAVARVIQVSVLESGLPPGKSSLFSFQPSRVLLSKSEGWPLSREYLSFESPYLQNVVEYQDTQKSTRLLKI